MFARAASVIPMCVCGASLGHRGSLRFNSFPAAVSVRSHSRLVSRNSCSNGHGGSQGMQLSSTSTLSRVRRSPAEVVQPLHVDRRYGRFCPLFDSYPGSGGWAGWCVCRFHQNCAVLVLKYCQTRLDPVGC